MYALHSVKQVPFFTYTQLLEWLVLFYFVATLFFCLFSKGEHRRAHHVLRDAFSFWVICNVSSIYIFMKTKKQSFFKMESFSLLIISLIE